MLNIFSLQYEIKNNKILQLAAQKKRKFNAQHNECNRIALL